MQLSVAHGLTGNVGYPKAKVCITSDEFLNTYKFYTYSNFGVVVKLVSLSAIKEHKKTSIIHYINLQTCAIPTVVLFFEIYYCPYIILEEAPITCSGIDKRFLNLENES